MVSLYDLETRVRNRQDDLRRQAAHEELLRLAAVARPARSQHDWFEPISGLLSAMKQIFVAPFGLGAPAQVACVSCP